MQNIIKELELPRLYRWSTTLYSVFYRIHIQESNSSNQKVNFYSALSVLRCISRWEAGSTKRNEVTHQTR